ncbi:cytochrome p450 [Diplodia corticola]|uniref:Cytochrome p450 n=1 Tax=Diplodia corticola TaxID=236234 RepID=A0A1J9QSU4_9PEZI|nr:cytochrome p450 [Diplodia corticola]OJD31473.1 cytochrome p450 [Diplodia corticola]
MFRLLFTLPIFYLVTLAIYRRFFHPLARFPGPPLAALSSLTLWWLYRKGFPEADFERWHEQYNSSVIRISPNELHVAGAEWYKKIYNYHSPPKYDVFYAGFLAPGSLFGQMEIAKHREKRKLMNPLFSKRTIAGIYPLVLERISCISQKISERLGTGPINIVDAYRCLTVDIISAYSFGITLDLTNEAPENFKADYLRIFDAALGVQKQIYNNPLKRDILPNLPFWAIMVLDKRARNVVKMFKHAAMCLQLVKERTTKVSYPVMFDMLDQYSDLEKISEAMSVLIAGSDTTAYTLSVGTFHILNAPEAREKLEKELREHIVDPDQMPSLGDLENLPYLVACMKESLRVSMPVSGRLPRVVPADGPPMVIDGQVIPPGAIIGCSAYSVHYDESVWGPDAREFRPERWLTDDAKHLANYLVTFSKGSRQCIGINLAEAELLAMFAHVFRKFDMELVTKTVTPRDVFATVLDEGEVKVSFKHNRV